jgi:2-C-methyl-D-erythritol 4-phosphate cytidylyltransferase
MEAKALIMVAGGRGERFGGERPKTLAQLGGRSVVARALDAFSGMVTHVVVVVPEGLEAEFTSIIGTGVQVVAGGERRQDSVGAGLRVLTAEYGWIFVHDAARPLVQPETVRAVFEAARIHGAAIPVLSVHDTVKSVDHESRVKRTLDRARIRLVQTPQCFRRDLLNNAYRACAVEGRKFTDEASMLENAGIPVMTVPGHPANLKITTPDDLAWAEAWLHALASGNRSSAEESA